MVVSDPGRTSTPTPSWRCKRRRGKIGRASCASDLADPARDLVIVPTTSPSPDYYGGERPGKNEHANSVVALQASTGKDRKSVVCFRSRRSGARSGDRANNVAEPRLLWW